MPARHFSATTVAACFVGVAVMAVVLDRGFFDPPVPAWALRGAALLSFGAFLSVARFDSGRLLNCGSRRLRPGLFVAAAGGSAGVLGATRLLPGAWILFEITIGLVLIGTWWQVNLGLARRISAPLLLIPLNFLMLIVAGTLVLKMPEALRAVTENPLALRDPIGGRLQWLDAVFTTTSVVCLTGLTVRDVAQFSAFGQTAIALLIQAGGLMTAVAGSILLVMRDPTVRDGRGIGGLFEAGLVRRITSLATFIIVVTLTCELIGALAMMPLWPRPMAWSSRLAASLFHSISAFCNSGFALPMDSLQSHRHSMLAHLVVAPLVVVGGLGCPVISDLWRTLRSRCRRGVTGATLSRHSRIVLATTCAVYLCGTVAYAAIHARRVADASAAAGLAATWRDLGPVVADGSFMSLSARSAGFTTVPTDGLNRVAEVVLMSQMIVGASPGGTGGGMKTTVVALLLIGAASTLRRRHAGRNGCSVGGRLILGACAVALFFTVLIAVSTLLLSVSESMPSGKVLFESVSAASASGLSAGITSELTRFGKGVIIATMFLGRVVPLVIAYVVLCGRGARDDAHREELVLIG